MSRTFEVVTPEQVAIRYELAGFGARAMAAMIDTLLQLGLLAVVVIIFGFALAPDLSADSFADKFGNSVIISLIILALFIISWGYYILFETLWNGETPGKRTLGLRVILDGGHPVDFRAVTVRNLLRAVDILPGMPPFLPIYGFGFIAILSHQQYKRLGDMAAGTLVVRHGREEDEPFKFTFGNAVVYRLLDNTLLSQLSRLTREEYRLVQRFLDRRSQLPQPLRAEFARRLATPLMEKFAYAIPVQGIDYERWLDELDLAYRTKSLGALLTPEPKAATATSVPSVKEDAPPPPTDERRW